MKRARRPLGPVSKRPRPLLRSTASSSTSQRLVETNSNTSETEEELLLDSVELCDAFTGVKLLLRKVIGRSPTAIPVTFRHHVYSVVRRRSTVDQELQACRDAGLVRVLWVNAGPSDRAVVLESDYISLVKKIQDDWTKEGRPSSQVAIIDRFLLNVLPKCKDESVSAKDLADFLSVSSASSGGIQFGRRAPEYVLCDAGLLMRRVDVFESDSFWFSMPTLGTLVGLIKEGRKQIIAAVKRKKNHEMLQRDLISMVEKRLMDPHAKRKKRTKTDSSASCSSSSSSSKSKGHTGIVEATGVMGIEYHIMDAVESGAVRSISTGLGPLIKLY